MSDPTDPTGEIAGTQSGLAEYVGPYVTNMLGETEALAAAPYQAYTGPLTAGESGLQTKAFTGYGGIDPNQTTTVNTYGGGFGLGPKYSGGFGLGSKYQAGFTPESYDLSGMEARRFTGKQVDRYMNPYLQAALEPQLAEARRQAEISRIADTGRLTRAGAFGGSRQAVMESEGGRNLADIQANITGKGYLDAFTQARDQFNTEQKMRQRIAEVGVDQFNKEQEALRLAEERRRDQFNIRGRRRDTAREDRRDQFNIRGRRRDAAREDKRDQFNEEERRRIATEEADRRFGLSALRDMREAGREQRDIEQEGITADYLQFEKERMNPFDMLRFKSEMLQGLPVGATQREFVDPSSMSELGTETAYLIELLRSLKILPPETGTGTGTDTGTDTGTGTDSETGGTGT